MEYNLIVYYKSESGYMTGRSAIHELLNKFGDPEAEIDLLVPGVIGVKTEIDARKVVDEAREVYMGEPDSIKHIKMLIPIDEWVNTDLEKIRRVVREECTSRITEEDHYRVDTSIAQHDIEEATIKNMVQEMSKGKIDEEHPHKIIRIDVYGQWTSITLLRPHNILTIQ